MEKREEGGEIKSLRGERRGEKEGGKQEGRTKRRVTRYSGLLHKPFYLLWKARIRVTMTKIMTDKFKI